MKYIDEKELSQIPINWNDMIQSISKATDIFEAGDFAQPIKPYLRYKEPQNRIIAMPAYIGGEINTAGIKWIASFPNNIHKNIKRAHSTIILNEADTGIPYAIINTAKVSGYRTASVTGAIIQKYVKDDERKEEDKYTVGIIGFGPIGQLHLEMIEDIMGPKVAQYLLFDLNKETANRIPDYLKGKTKVVSTWEEAYSTADIFCTCTVSSAPYIDKKPKPGSLHLNVSLRDYKASCRSFFDTIIVDDWDEVCREKTDVEMMHLEEGLQREDTITIGDYIFDKKKIDKSKNIMFNPMGMALYDMAVAEYIYNLSNTVNAGKSL
ncbi:2,3-diaminopropionate biosynthesis protein SbnB [uncultured Kordia sp.]|uniref:2,3-diaminopropionate biosynthesis protein SbnB n=1 Tax=uncultured Kordia sp. TaxID=507699 RepID=UPI00260EDAA8|nr:2,3-diaminopropionate biosynthesis protein SbnB [uncultured Kordia sp.]